jgi:hypothetical protein
VGDVAVAAAAQRRAEKRLLDKLQPLPIVLELEVVASEVAKPKELFEMAVSIVRNDGGPDLRDIGAHRAQ